MWAIQNENKLDENFALLEDIFFLVLFKITSQILSVATVSTDVQSRGFRQGFIK